MDSLRERSKIDVLSIALCILKFVTAKAKVNKTCILLIFTLCNDMVDFNEKNGKTFARSLGNIALKGYYFSSNIQYSRQEYSIVKKAIY